MKNRKSILILSCLISLFSLGSCTQDYPPMDLEKLSYEFEFKLEVPTGFEPIVSAPENGFYEENSTLSVAISYVEIEKYNFDGYYVNGNKVSEKANYTFKINEDIVLTAKFSENEDYNEEEPLPEEDKNLIEKGKFGFWNDRESEALYFNGEYDTSVLNSTADYTDAVDIASLGMFGNKVALKVLSGINEGKYISPIFSETEANLVLTDEAFPWIYNDEYDAYTAQKNNTDQYFIGFNEYGAINDKFSLFDFNLIDNYFFSVAHIVQEPIEGEISNYKVKVGLQANLGSGAAYSAIQQGFFDDEDLYIETTIGNTPALVQELINGNINVSFLGNGVAWNYFVENPKITLVALDNLTNDDKLIARKDGKGGQLNTESSIEELASALRGARVALDMNSTAYSFFTSLLLKINETLDESNKVWFKGFNLQYIPHGLSVYEPANEIFVDTVRNVNIPATMQNENYDFCVPFCPVTTELLKNKNDYIEVASYYTHLYDSYVPSTWAVNTNWLKTNEEVFKKFMSGLVQGMNFRRDYPQESEKDIEMVTYGSFLATGATDIAVWLGAEEQLELIESGDAMKFVENIRQSHANGANADKISENITAEVAADFSYLKEACESLI